MVWDEAGTIQKAIIGWAVAAGWHHVAGADLPRDHHGALIEP